MPIRQRLGTKVSTVFLNNQYVYIRTGEYSFRFDERAKKIKRLEAPWPILPVWTKHNEVADEVNTIFDKTNKKFPVQIALRPDDANLLHKGSKSYETLFKKVFKDSNIILFIPKINSVSVFINGNQECLCKRNNAQWIVNTYEKEIDADLQDLINRTIETGRSRIPEKYKDFAATQVSFACKLDGAKQVEPINKSILYCYLPTKATWGFPFLMNTDMIPKGDRNDIETEVELIDEDSTNFNIELAGIAGTQLFKWISELLDSKKYQSGSIFALIPDFETCIKEHEEYEAYIENFKESFENMLKKTPIVPVGNGVTAIVSDVIYDETGLSCSGIMTDEEFYSFTDFDVDNLLPIHSLRTDKRFTVFHERYVYITNAFDKERLHNMIQCEEFQEWLMNQENNNKFLNFLLEKNYLEDFMEEDIFIEEECGDLYSAGDLYYNIDEELKDLSPFSNYMRYLSIKTREYFKDNKKWNKVISDVFDEFDGDRFITETLLENNWNETVEALNEWDTSFHFFSYLAKNEIVPDDLLDLPFFSDTTEDGIVDNFKDKFVFFSSDEGKETCSASWLSPITFAFISPNYDKKTLLYFKKYAEVRDFNDSIIIKEIVLSEDFESDINDAQQENDETSTTFVKYCFKHKNLFEAGSLRDYALNASDCNGDYEFVLYENHIYFPSLCFDDYSEKKWLNADWMYCLDSVYLNIESAEDEVKKFLKKAFCIEELDDKKFYKEVVLDNIESIIDNTCGDNDEDGEKNIDFVSYLDCNYKLIFEKEQDAEKFESFVFLSDMNDGYCDIDSDASYVYAYDSELKQILESEWFPADTVNMCSERYGKSNAILAIKAKPYDFGKFFDDVIKEELSNINDAISSKESSIAFHNFIIERLVDLTDRQKEVMKEAKVYLYGSDEASDSSTGHHILSKSAQELSDMGLVEFSDLDIIDPDYNIKDNGDYWIKRLRNEQFTVNEFIKWLGENTDTFNETIEDKDKNINFWRWVKGCKLADQTIANLPTLPIFLNSDKYTDSNDTIYLSDDYIDEGGLETIVKNYYPEASFISADYLKEDDDIDTWKDFWVKMGVRFEMVDILIDTIDNRLSKTEDEKLPVTIAKYRSKLDEHYEGKLISNLKSLRVKAHDGEFYSLSDILYVDCEKEEPFKFIELPNQATFETADERKLIMEIIHEIGGTKIGRLTDWQAAKINRYLEIQGNKEQEELLVSIHYKFVDELAVMYTADKDSFKDYKNITEVLFLDSKDKFTKATALTEGSLYSPFCDFEKYGLDYTYLSKSYNKECNNDIRKMLNRIFKVHCDFKKDDICNLAKRDFAIYFWSQYLIKKDADISGIKILIENKEFDSIACVPTKDYMKKPGEVYAISISSFVAKHVDDWENKLPLQSLPEIEYDKKEKETLFGLLLNKPSNLRLSFCDSLSALFTIAGQERRVQLLQWMIDTYDEKYKVDIDEYRDDESALWQNVKNEKIHIKKLYALSYGEKKLEQYFGTLPQIINKDYLPTGSSFKEACDILRIKTIEPEDLIVDPIGKKSQNSLYKQKMKIFALVLAGYEDSKNWSSKYEQYCKRIDEINFWCCSSIALRYKFDEEISQKMKKFYHENNSADFYFVKSLDEKLVFIPFVESFIEYLGIEDEVDFVRTVMDSSDSALDLAKDNNTLMLDEDFKNALEKLIHGIKHKLNGNEADDDDDIDDGQQRTKFTHDVGVPEGEEEGDEEGDEQTGSHRKPESTNNSTEENSSNLYEGEEEGEESEEQTGSHRKLESTNNSTEGNRSNSYDDEEDGEESEFTEQSRAGNGTNSAGREHRSDEYDNHDYSPKDTTSNDTNDSFDERREHGTRPHNNNGWGKRPYTTNPTPPTREQIFGSNGRQRSLEVLDPTRAELDDINRILEGDLTSKEILDQHYLVRLRLFRSLQQHGMQPKESESDFIKHNHNYMLKGGKYIHTCSATGGIMYISPSVWNKVADDNCIVCVYLGAKANEFMYFNSIDDILKWIKEDDIVIKLTGEEKAEAVQMLYSSVLNNVKGTAYTMIRVASNEKYDSVFAPLLNDPTDQQQESEEDY